MPCTTNSSSRTLATASHGGVGVEIAVDTRQHGAGNLVLMGGAAQQAFFFRIADKGGFNQDGWNIGCFQHGEPCPLHPLFMEAADFTDFMQHPVAHTHGVIALGCSRSEEQTSELQS